MRKFLVMIVAAAALLAFQTPAYAVFRGGTVCHTYVSNNGGAKVKVCVDVTSSTSGPDVWGHASFDPVGSANEPSAMYVPALILWQHYGTSALCHGAWPGCSGLGDYQGYPIVPDDIATMHYNAAQQPPGGIACHSELQIYITWPAGGTEYHDFNSGLAEC